MPPLVRLPAAPREFTALRQGATVTLQLTVPTANADGSTPADIDQVVVFSHTGLPTVGADDIVRHGVRVGTVAVNPPPDPDVPEDDEAEAKRKRAGGIDQGQSARLTDALSLSTASVDDVRSYVGVGVTKRGRRGPPTAPVLVPLVAGPPPPAAPDITYDEKAITVTWTPLPAPAGGVRVYGKTDPETRLTPDPVVTGSYSDTRVEFGVERCYVLRTVMTVAASTIESEASPSACVTPKDTFPPAAPGGLNAVPETGAVSLIWNPVETPDLAGYLVLRAIAPSTNLVPITPDPLADTTFRDTSVPSGARVTYAIQAVDKSGNRSVPSAVIDETVR